jgi:hypothetical protein
MKRALIGIFLLTVQALYSQAIAQTDAERLAKEANAHQGRLDAQIRAMKEAEGKAEAERRASQAAWQQEQIRINAEKIAAEEAKRKMVADRLAREEAKKEEERQLLLEAKRLDLEMQKRRVKRADDYIDRELKRQDAEIDVVKSDADVKRNDSQGRKALLEGVGKGAEHAGKNPPKPANITINNRTIEKY